MTFALVLLASVSIARANITYNIVDYPVNEMDIKNPDQQDYVSGTITTDGTLGYITQSNVVGWTLTVGGGGNSCSSSSAASSSWWSSSTSLYATTTQLAVPADGSIWFGTNNTPAAPLSFIEYVVQPSANNPADAVYAAQIALYSAWGVPPIAQDYYGVGPEGISPVLDTPGSIATSPSALPGGWVVASTQPVPEPGTLALLISAMLGLAGAFYLRRNRAKAA
jgi:hypothetical protein